MSNKTTFKRISLVLVAALGFGVISSGASQADIQAGTTMTATVVKSTATATVDTATAKIDVSATALTDGQNDTITVTAVLTSSGAASGGAQWRGPTSADSANVSALTVSSLVLTAVPVSDKVNTFTGYFDVIQPTTAGTYTYTFYLNYSSDNAAVAKPAPVTFTYTVSAANTKPAATQSSAYLVDKTFVGDTPVASPCVANAAACVGGARPNMGDSTIVASAGTVAGGAQAVANIVWLQRNSDSSTSVVVAESVTAVISGAGLLSVAGKSTRAGAVTAASYESITVWSDARGGTGTITLTTTSMTTWATKSVTFYSTAASTSLTAVRGKVSKTGSDSAAALRVTLKDANSTNVAGTNTNMYVHSSDTKVVSNGLCVVNVDATLGYGTCSLSGLVGDSGTTKIKVANYAFESTTAQKAAGFVSAEEVTIQVVGAPKTIKATFDKSSYNPGEEATVTLTLTDGLGNVVDTHTVINALTVAGLDYNVGTDMTDTASITFNSGKKTYTYVMPSTGQKVTLSYTGGAGISGGTQTADSVTVTVVDPAEEAANSALDAAQEATDAAIAATDAAVLAQESADAAAVAAEAAAETAAEAAEAAKAAVDAVTKLSAEVTKLLTQLATLQKLMNRIAKKVGVKV